MKQHFETAEQSLTGKLSLLATSEAISLSLEEAAIYGVDQSDILPQEEEVEDGR